MVEGGLVVSSERRGRRSKTGRDLTPDEGIRGQKDELDMELDYGVWGEGVREPFVSCYSSDGLAFHSHSSFLELIFTGTGLQTGASYGFRVIKRNSSGQLC